MPLLHLPAGEGRNLLLNYLKYDLNALHARQNRYAGVR